MRAKLFGRLAGIVAAAAVVAVSISVASFAEPPKAAPVPDPPGILKVEFIDVGQGDAALISCDGEHMLIDGGPTAESSKMYTILKDKGISHLDYVVFSHTDEDHVGGLSGALQYADVGACYGPTDARDTKAFASFKKRLTDQGKGITVPDGTLDFALGGAEVTLMHVTVEGTDTNDDELVARIVYGSTSFLFTGDISSEAEKSLVDSGADIESTVLKVPHHGSNSSSSYAFLRAVNPSISVISVGADNDYGHPTEKVLSRYRDLGCALYRTDLQGDVTATSDGQTVTVQTARVATKDLYTPGVQASGTY
ncbi:MAG: MBL fold metallo-hydrolase [Eggerthellaceae bacterium]|nr:MBL fold metallo-hydrolase [Eggerthellaceae bacterium]